MATINLADYDSAAVRAAARKLSSCARTLEGGTVSQIKSIKSQIPANLKGEAADALTVRMNEMSRDVSTLLGGINGLVKALNRYADELDATARRLRAQMQG